MKKVMVGILGIVLMCSVVLAADTTGPFHDEIVAAGGLEGEGARVMANAQGRIMAGEYRMNGDRLMIREMTADRIQLQVRNISADCECNLTGEYDPVQNWTKLNIALSNGRNAEIKIMPDTASETALARLRLNVCDGTRDCSIELKEVGQGEEVRAAYEVRAKKTFRILGLFRNSEEVRTQIDAETGEEIETRRPWWAWLASEEDEADEIVE